MNTTRPPGDGKLFVVPRHVKPAQQPPEAKKRAAHLPGNALIPLALIFLAIVGLAAYLSDCGNWERAKDLLLIFLPPIAALMGAAIRSHP